MTKYKYLIVLVVLLLVVLAGGWAYQFYNKPVEELASEVAAKLEVTTYSVEGDIFSIGTDNVVIKAARVERSEEGNVVTEYEKTIFFTNPVQFSAKFKASVHPVALSRAELLSQFKVGDRAVFYGQGQLSADGNEDKFRAQRVDLLRTAVE